MRKSGRLLRVSKALNMLGLACRARKTAIGETCMHAVTSRKAYVVFLASDASERTKDKVLHTCNSCGVPCVTQFTSIEISSAIGQYGRMMISVNDAGFAKQILNCLK